MAKEKKNAGRWKTAAAGRPAPTDRDRRDGLALRSRSVQGHCALDMGSCLQQKRQTTKMRFSFFFFFHVQGTLIDRFQNPPDVIIIINIIISIITIHPSRSQFRL